MESILAKRRLATDATITQTGRILQIFFSIAFVIIIARVLGPYEFGVFSTIVAVQTACFAIADLGLGQLAMRAVAQQRSEDAVGIRTAMPQLFLAASAVVVLSTILSLVLIGQNWMTLVASMLIGGCYVVSPARIAVERGFWLGALRFGKATLIDVIAAGARLVGVAAVWLGGGTSLLPYASGLAASGVVTIVVVKWWLSYPSPLVLNVGGTDRKVLLREAAPFALSSLTWNTFGELPKILLAPIAGPAAVGQYAAAARFLAAALIPLQSLLLVISPRLYAFAGGTGSSAPAPTHPLLRLTSLATGVGGGLTLFVILLAPLLSTMLGPEYRPAVPVLRILAISLPFQAIAFATGDWLGGVGRQPLRLLLTVGTAILAVPVLWVGARASGVLGAAAAYTFLMAVLAMATAYASRRSLSP
jgi:PST family polysaccharide transporter